MSYHKASEVHRGPGAVAAVDAVSPIRRRVRQARARRSAQLDRRLAAIVRHPQSMGMISRGTNLTTRPSAPAPTQVYVPPPPPPPPATPVTTVVSGVFGRPTRTVSSTGTTFGTGTHQPGNVGPLPNPTLSPGGRMGIHPSSFPPTVHPTFPSGGGDTSSSSGVSSSGASTSSGGGGGGGGAYDPSSYPGVDTSSLTPPDALPDVDLPVVGKINTKWLLLGGAALAAFAFWNQDD